MSDWCTIESDPGVFTSLIESFGVQNAQLTELWALDDDSLKCILESHGKVHGLVFLFKWQSSNAISQTNSQTNGNANSDGDGDASSSKPLPLVGGEAPEDLFFARQVTTNACATQAILSILLNAQINNGYTNDGNDALSLSLSLSLGETLTNLKEFTSSFPPDLKGESIGASEEIREAHNSFARKEAFCLMSDNEKRVAGKDDEVFHFVAYVPHHDGTVYELDGLQPGPIPVGTYTTNTDGASADPTGSATATANATDDFPWLSVARSAIQTRIEKYQSSEIKFNLMALTADKRSVLQSKIKSAAGMGDESDSASVGLVASLNMELVAEEELRENWKEENERRRHNYLPFCVELLGALGRSGTLQGCTKRANEKMARVRAERRAL